MVKPWGQDSRHLERKMTRKSNRGPLGANNILFIDVGVGLCSVREHSVSCTVLGTFSICIFYSLKRVFKKRKGKNRDGYTF